MNKNKNKGITELNSDYVSKIICNYLYFKKKVIFFRPKKLKKKTRIK